MQKKEEMTIFRAYMTGLGVITAAVLWTFLTRASGDLYDWFTKKEKL